MAIDKMDEVKFVCDYKDRIKENGNRSLVTWDKVSIYDAKTSSNSLPNDIKSIKLEIEAGHIAVLFVEQYKNEKNKKEVKTEITEITKYALVGAEFDITAVRLTD